MNDIIKQEIDDVVKQPEKWFHLFLILEKYNTPEAVMKMLKIGRTSYYNYKKSHKSRYIERKLFEYYNNL